MRVGLEVVEQVPTNSHRVFEAVLLKLIPASFTERFSTSVLEDLGRKSEESEVLVALKKMAAEKSSGLDGVLTEFYLKFWGIIEKDFLPNAHHCFR